MFYQIICHNETNIPINNCMNNTFIHSNIFLKTAEKKTLREINNKDGFLASPACFFDMN